MTIYRRPVFLIGIAALVVAWLTISVMAARAASTTPASALRYE